MSLSRSAAGRQLLSRSGGFATLNRGGEAMKKRVLSVGQCGLDHGNISRALERSFDVQVVPAGTAAEALEQLRGGEFALVLVNRILDANGGSGLEVIRQVRAASTAPVMLVSNYEEAQQEAAAAGAVPGFGKAAVGRPEMLSRVRPFLESAAMEPS
jgi:two-component system chemotaxis response regulator CheY